MSTTAHFVPFANEADVVHVGKLMIENRLDRITFSGEVDLLADQGGLLMAHQLQALVNALVAELEGRLAQRKLPDVLPAPEVRVVDNPFN